jgi:hypothetical protein
LKDAVVNTDPVSMKCLNYLSKKLENCSESYNKCFGDGGGSKYNENLSSFDNIFTRKVGKKNFTCFDSGKCFMFLVFTALLTYYWYYTKDGIQLSRIKKDKRRNYIAQNLLMGSIIATYYIYFMINIQLDHYIKKIFWVLVGVIQVGFCGFKTNSAIMSF